MAGCSLQDDGSFTDPFHGVAGCRQVILGYNTWHSPFPCWTLLPFFPSRKRIKAPLCAFLLNQKENLCMYVCLCVWIEVWFYMLKLAAAPQQYTLHSALYTLHSSRFVPRNIFCIIELLKLVLVLAISIDEAPPQRLFSENLFYGSPYKTQHFTLCPLFNLLYTIQKYQNTELESTLL